MTYGIYSFSATLTHTKSSTLRRVNWSAKSSTLDLSCQQDTNDSLRILLSLSEFIEDSMELRIACIIEIER